MIAPLHGENYDAHWRGVDWTDKRVLDIGADVGSTAYYFLSKGASIVYAVEGNPVLYTKLEMNAQVFSGIIPLFLYVASPEQLAGLFSEFHLDIVKIDCEGCEKNLLEMEDFTLASIPEFIIEAHNYALLTAIEQKLSNLGFTISTYRYFRLWVIHAENIANGFLFIG